MAEQYEQIARLAEIEAKKLHAYSDPGGVSGQQGELRPPEVIQLSPNIKDFLIDLLFKANLMLTDALRKRSVEELFEQLDKLVFVKLLEQLSPQHRQQLLDMVNKCRPVPERERFIITHCHRSQATLDGSSELAKTYSALTTDQKRVDFMPGPLSDMETR